MSTSGTNNVPVRVEHDKIEYPVCHVQDCALLFVSRHHCAIVLINETTRADTEIDTIHHRIRNTTKAKAFSSPFFFERYPIDLFLSLCCADERIIDYKPCKSKRFMELIHVILAESLWNDLMV